MKTFLEEEIEEEINGEVVKTYKKVKEVKDKEEAISEKIKDKKCFVHKCRHDEGGSCSREEI